MTITKTDPALVQHARKVILEERNPSVALLQRKLKVDCDLASRLMQALEGDAVTSADQNGWHRLRGSGERSPDDPQYRGLQTSVDVSHSSLVRTERAIGALMGLAVGDAIGTTLEFVPRQKITVPLTDMVGGGPFKLQPGQWTDDTSMALCLGESLLEHGFDMHDQLNRYLDWYEHGYLSSTGACFDIGGTTVDALERYKERGVTRAGSADPNDAGNGCIMRLAPVVIYFQDNPESAIHYAQEQSKTTHRAPECLMACQLMAEVLLRALQGKTKDDVLAPSLLQLDWTDGMRSVAHGQYRNKTKEQIKGSGYVVQSLEAALWCFATTSNFAECVLAAANLGDDADTTAAVAGQIAGAHYYVRGIPQAWQERVYMSDTIKRMALRLMAPH